MERVILRHKIANYLANKIKNIKSGYLGRVRFLLIYFIYHFLPLFGFDYSRLIEWRFILKNLPKNKKLRILDVGCTSSLFIYELARYGKVFGVDARPYFENLPKTIKFLQCDVSKTPFPDNYFDCITAISVIEHIGLGAYTDPAYDNGDFKAMEELRRIVRVGGMLFITTVIGNKYIITPNGNERIYDEERFGKLIEKNSLSQKKNIIFLEEDGSLLIKKRPFWNLRSFCPP
jgi:SAM-dependent methyltransferase